MFTLSLNHVKIYITKLCWFSYVYFNLKMLMLRASCPWLEIKQIGCSEVKIQERKKTGIFPDSNQGHIWLEPQASTPLPPPTTAFTKHLQAFNRVS